MLIIGLTGGIGSGKSTVADLFQQLGITIIDTDLISRQLSEPGQAAFKEITSTFNSVLTIDGQLDRNKLRDIVFNEPDKRLELEKILHPRIQETARQMLEDCDAPYAIIVIPLLAEKGKWSFIDRVLVVDSDPQQQLERSMKRDAATEQQINKIIQAQASRQQRQAIADDIILNEGDLPSLKQQVEKLDHQYRQLAGKAHN